MKWHARKLIRLMLCVLVSSWLQGKGEREREKVTFLSCFFFLADRFAAGSSRRFGLGTGQIYRLPMCNGNEATLDECNAGQSLSQARECNHNHDVGVVCEGTVLGGYGGLRYLLLVSSTLIVWGPTTAASWLKLLPGWWYSVENLDYD